MKIALGGLGFSTDEFEKPFTSFSGGWRMCATLAEMGRSDVDVEVLSGLR